LAIRYQDRLPLKYRVLGPLILNCSIFILTTVFVTVSINPLVLFGITLLSCCVVGSSNALLSGGIFGLAGSFPPQYTGAVMSGQGLAGLVVSIASLVTTWAGNPVDMCTDDDAADDDGDCEDYVDYSALSFFIISCVVMGSCVFTFIALLALPFTSYYQNKALEDMKRGPSIVGNDKQISNPTEADALLDDLLDSSGEEQVAYEVTPERVWRIFNFVKPAAAGAYLTFAVTLALFPSITVLIESSQQCSSNATRFNNDLFIPFMFLLFNLFDFIGRLFAGVSKLGLTPDTVWIVALCRVIFFPLFLFCNVSGSRLPVLFHSDAFPILFMIAFALSNGYVSTLSMMFGPTMVSNRHSNLAGTIMVFCLTSGLMSGSALSFVMLVISQGSV
jgi:solute carrier family 29 (equilibrative nucleoside transporter), member 1/2/3